MAEGVGFEPTVGCPTLDFESSALNRTQPPFRTELSMVKGAPLCNGHGPYENVVCASNPSATRLLNRQVIRAMGQHHRMFFKVALAIETMAKARKGKKYRP